MKKLIYGGLFLALVGIFFVGCKKQEVVLKDTSLTSQNYEKSAGSTSQNGRLSSEQIEEIGNLHNHYLELAFKDFDYSTENKTT